MTFLCITSRSVITAVITSLCCVFLTEAGCSNTLTNCPTYGCESWGIEEECAIDNEDKPFRLCQKTYIKSDEVCSSGGKVDCLRFGFKGETSLNITVRRKGAENVLEQTFQIFSSSKWKSQTVNLQTNYNYFIHMIPGQTGNDGVVARVRNIKFYKAESEKCITFTATTTQASTTASPSQTAKSTSGSVGIAAAVVVVLLLLILAIFVVIVILFRRGKLQFLKNIACFTILADRLASCFAFNCCKEKDQPKTDTEKAADTTRTGYSGLTRSMISQPLDLQDSTHPTEDYYSIIKDEGQHDKTVGHHQTGPGTASHTGEDEYSIIRDSAVGVSEPDGIYRTPPEGPPANRGKYQPQEQKTAGKSAPNVADPTGIYHDGPGPIPTGTGTTSSTGPAATGIVGVYHEGPGIVPKPTGGAAGVYHTLHPESDASANGQGRPVYHVPSQMPRGAAVSSTPNTDDYNALDFEVKETPKKGVESGEGKVYSHLNEGDEDAYNEMQREQKREVIDGDYSHI